MVSVVILSVLSVSSISYVRFDVVIVCEFHPELIVVCVCMSLQICEV